MHHLPIADFIARVGREEGRDLSSLVPFVQQLCTDSHGLAFVRPSELVELGVSREMAKLLTARALGWMDRPKYDLLEFFFGVDGVFTRRQTPAARERVKPARFQD